LVVAQWLLKRYVPNKEDALVLPVLFSIIFLMGRVIDGVTDPLIGFWSDHCQTKRGRRIPFILYGTLPFAVVFFLLWTPPFPDQMHWLNAVYIFVMVQILFILMTIVVTPYLSLIPELTSSLKERINITTTQAVFILIGTIIFGTLGPIKAQVGWTGMGATIAILTLVSFYPTVFFIKEKSSPNPDKTKVKIKFSLLVDWVKTTLKNRPFIFLVASTSCYWFALNIVILLVPYWIEYVVGSFDPNHIMKGVELGLPVSDIKAAVQSNVDNLTGAVMGPFLIMNLIFFFVFNFLTKKFGKFIMFCATIIGTAITIAGLLLVGYLPFGDSLLQTQFLIGLIGIPVAGFMVLPFAILSDVVDYDEQLTGKRREAIYFGVQAIFQKTSIGVSIVVAAWLMYLGGGKIPTVTGLKASALLAGIVAVISFIIFLGYKLREKDGKIYLKNQG
jgi:GPH family glycoside/pentoside/hexuronide:cation symporter